MGRVSVEKVKLPGSLRTTCSFIDLQREIGVSTEFSAAAESCFALYLFPPRPGAGLSAASGPRIAHSSLQSPARGGVQAAPLSGAGGLSVAVSGALLATRGFFWERCQLGSRDGDMEMSGVAGRRVWWLFEGTVPPEVKDITLAHTGAARRTVTQWSPAG